MIFPPFPFDLMTVTSTPDPAVWWCDGCGRCLVKRGGGYPTLCACGGVWRAKPAQPAGPELCKRCTFTDVLPGGRCSYCDWRRP